VTEPELDLAEGNGPVGLQMGAGEVPLAEVRALLVTLTKALRAFQLYEENNPVYQRFITALRTALASLWTHSDRLQLGVEEERFTWFGEEVYRGESRSDSLSFLLYKDGIRELTFLPGMEEEELESFLRVLQRARNSGPQGDDLLTILWEADLQMVRYAYMDLLWDGEDVPSGSPDTSLDLRPVLEGELQPQGAEEEEETREVHEAPEGGPPIQSSISRDDFNPTLYALDPAEMEEVLRELEREMNRPLREDVLTALFERLEESWRPDRQSEILGILSTLLPNFLSHGALRRAGDVLEELSRLRGREGIFDEVRQREVDGILDSLSTPEALQELVRAVEERAITPTAPELAAFVRHLRGGALGPLLRASEVMEDRELRPVILDGVRAIADANRGALVHFLGVDDPLVLRAAARLAGRIRLGEAGAGITRLLRHADPSVRLAAVEAAVGLRTAAVTGAVQDALFDADREVRMAAARGLGELNYRPAAGAFREALKGKALRQGDLSEKIAFFESYGALGDPGAVELLGGLLNGRGFLGRKEPPEIRACAALALGKVGSPEALQSLERARGEADPVIRSAVNRALRVEEGG